VAQDTFRGLIIGTMLFGLFITLLITAIYGMGVNYGVSPEKLNEVTGGAYDTDGYSTELEEIDTTTENFRERFESGQVDDIDDPSGVFSILGDLVSVLVTPFSILGEVGENIGIPTIVTSTIFAIVFLLIIFGIWRTIRAGD